MSKLCDEWWKARAKRLEADRKAAELKSVEHQLKTRILEVMAESGVHNVGGKLVSLEYRTDKRKASVKNWDEVFEYVRKKKAWDLIQRRINDAAVLARVDDKVTVPGVEVILVYDFSYHQLKK